MKEKIGTLIDELRLKAGYETLGQLRKASNVTVATLSRIINNKQSPTPETLRKLSECLNVTHEHLLMMAGYIDKEKPTSKEDKKPKDLIKFLEQAEVMFDGELYKLDDEDKAKLRAALEFGFWNAKEKNKRKKNKTQPE